MKLFYLIVGIVFTFALLYLTFINIDHMSTLDMLGRNVSEVNSGILIISSAIMGIIISTSLWGYFFQVSKNQQSKHLRAAEKASINAEESKDKVKALEAKIQTLEEALKKALDTNK